MKGNFLIVALSILTVFVSTIQAIPRRSAITNIEMEDSHLVEDIVEYPNDKENHSHGHHRKHKADETEKRSASNNDISNESLAEDTQKEKSDKTGMLEVGFIPDKEYILNVQKGIRLPPGVLPFAVNAQEN